MGADELPPMDPFSEPLVAEADGPDLADID